MDTKQTTTESGVEVATIDALAVDAGGTAASFKRTIKFHFYQVLITGIDKDRSKFVSDTLQDLSISQTGKSKTVHYQKGKRVGINLGFIRRHAIEEIYTFLFLRSRLSVGDQSLINLTTFSMEPLDKRLLLDNDEGLGAYALGAYDSRNNILALQTLRTPNKTDLEEYLSNRTGRSVRLNFVIDVNADKIFDSMDVRRFSMSVAIPNIEKKAPLFAETETQQIEIESDLIKYAQKFDGDMISMDVSASMSPDAEEAKSHLRKEAIRSEASVLKRIFTSPLFKRKPKAVATGRVPLPEGEWLNNRSIDLIEGLLLWQDEVELSQDAESLLTTLESLAVRAINQTRPSYTSDKDIS